VGALIEPGRVIRLRERLWRVGRVEATEFAATPLDGEGGNSLPRTPYSRYRPRGLSRRLRHSHHMTKLARFVPSSGHRELSARHRGLLWPLSAKIFRRDRQSGLDRNRAITALPRL